MRSMPAPPSPPLLLDAGFAMLRMGAAATMASPAALASRAVFFVLVMCVVSAFWGLVAREGENAGLVSQLPAHGLLLYVGVTEWIILSVPAIHLRLEDDFRRGAIEARMLQPPSPLFMRVTEAIGGLLARLAVLGLTGVAALVLLTDHPGLPWHAWPVVALFGVVGGVVGILLQALVGMSCAWLRSNMPVFFVVQKCSFLLGGLFGPITLYPGWLESAAKLSPFAAHLFWPASLAITPAPQLAGQAALAMASAATWIALLALALAALWRLAAHKLLRDGAG